MTLTQTYDPVIPLAGITEHPDNPRRGDDGLVSESIEELGFFGAILVHQATGHILAGNTRYRALTAKGEATVSGFWIDCDDETAHRILLMDNRASDLAYYDDQALVELLTMVRSYDGSLVGTGYDEASYELLIAAANSDAILGGVRQGMRPSDRSDAYEASDIRSVILPYIAADYDFVVGKLAELRTEWDYPTNAEVVHRLLRDVET